MVETNARLKNAVREVVPPFAFRMLRNLGERIRPSSGGGASSTRTRSFEEDPRQAIYLQGKIPFLVDSADLRYSGGLAFTVSQHHFIQYYHDGRTALEAFYRCHQPKNIFERHFITNYESPVRLEVLPWSWNQKVSKAGEGGLDRSHGTQHFGPVSAAKIDFEVKRLDGVLESLRKFGYREDLGLPRGYFLEHEQGELKFVIVGGQHRVAALSFLGADSVKVIFQPDCPRVIRRQDVRDWPRVRDQSVSPYMALKIFDSYFRSPALRLVSGSFQSQGVFE